MFYTVLCIISIASGLWIGYRDARHLKEKGITTGAFLLVLLTVLFGVGRLAMGRGVYGTGLLGKGVYLICLFGVCALVSFFSTFFFFISKKDKERRDELTDFANSLFYEQHKGDWGGKDAGTAYDELVNDPGFYGEYLAYKEQTLLLCPRKRKGA